ncbi:MAG: hypothetical protein MJ211_15465 [Bacteroidales bacterium]|nr:hypothetical protein [Bacteroidales bacterium]
MKSKLGKLLAFVAATAVISLPSCSGDGNNNNNNNKQDSTKTEESFAEVQEESNFYLIPSPEDLFAFTKDKNLQYDASFLNPIENIDKYGDNRSQELNFGTYTADMAYSAAFGKYQESLKEFKVVRELSDKINIGSVFTQNLVDRIESVVEDRDSLKEISSDIYYDIEKFLDSKQRSKTMALISTGGWIEFLYIVTNSIEKFDANNETIQRIADQKIILDNLMLRLEQIQDDMSVKQTISDLKPLKEVFDGLKVESVQSQSSKTSNGSIKVGGGMKIIITENDFNKIKETIASVRNNITCNDVSK